MGMEGFVLRIAKVDSVFDSDDGGRIRALVLPEDRGKSWDDIPYAFPLLPKMMHIVPKVGEAVLILTAKLDDANSQRYYLGPIIHQPQFMNFDSYEIGATTMLDGGPGSPSLAPSYDPESSGALPQIEDIALMGRKNTDIVLGENDVKIECGVRLLNEDTEEIKFNRTTPTYIKLKQHSAELSDNSKSSATIVSENINLISTVGTPYIDVADNKELITDDALNKILEEAHVLPYGDILVKFLGIFVEAFKAHTHPYPGMPPVQETTYMNVNNFDLNTILSKNVRIN